MYACAFTLVSKPHKQGRVSLCVHAGHWTSLVFRGTYSVVGYASLFIRTPDVGRLNCVLVVSVNTGAESVPWDIPEKWRGRAAVCGDAQPKKIMPNYPQE